MSTPAKCIRLPEGLSERIEAIAKAQGIKFSAALRIALQRGVADIEREVGPAPHPRRRIISRGIT